MTIIKGKNGGFGIYNGAGLQVEGNFSPNLNGLNPKELLEASIAMCITIVLKRIFERDGIEINEEEFSVEATAIKAQDLPSRFDKCMLTISLPERFSNEYKHKILVSAERACTISNTLKSGVAVMINTEANTK